MMYEACGGARGNEVVSALPIIASTSSVRLPAVGLSTHARANKEERWVTLLVRLGEAAERDAEKSGR